MGCLKHVRPKAITKALLIFALRKTKNWKGMTTKTTTMIWELYCLEVEAKLTLRKTSECQSSEFIFLITIDSLFTESDNKSAGVSSF